VGHLFEVVVHTIASNKHFSFVLRSNHEGRVDLGVLFEVVSISALGYVFPVSTHFISPSCSQIVVPHVAQGTIFIPADLIANELFPQFSCFMNHVMCRSDSRNVIFCVPDAIRSSERNGVVINVPLPGLYIVRLYCREGVRDISMRVVEAAAGSGMLSLDEGAKCELFQPVVPIDCRISSIACQDHNLLVTVAGSAATYEKMKLSVWLCNSFPLGTNFTGQTHLPFSLQLLAKKKIKTHLQTSPLFHPIVWMDPRISKIQDQEH
jgi:hypothetical protein